MKRCLLFLFIISLLLSSGVVPAQETGKNQNPRKLILIPLESDSSGGKNFCICKIVSFTSDNNDQRTDAIFAGSTEEKPSSKKELMKNIQYEMAQAMVFFDSYKVVGQYAAAADCSELYAFVKTKRENIGRLTILELPYASK